MRGKDSRGVESIRGNARRIHWSVGLVVLAIVGGTIGVRYFWGASWARAGSGGIGGLLTGSRSQPESAAPTAAPRQTLANQQAPTASRANPATQSPEQQANEKPQIVAIVNGEPITREELRTECLRAYGEEVLETAINKYLILEECQRRGITVTSQEIDEEIQRMSTRFGIPVETWLKLLKDERGIKPDQYKRDIIWPMLSLRKLAGNRLLVTDEEIQQQFETRYGPAVKARLIVTSSRQAAEKVRAEAVAHPEQFGDLAKQYSEDASSASLKGLIQPIRKHVGQKEIEDIAFSLKPGEISPIIPVANQFVILKCEDRLPPANVRLTDVRGELEELAKDDKMRIVAQEIFRDVQSRAKIVNVLNDPQGRARMPGIAALINGRPIRLEDLGEMCIDRHGEDILDDMISRRMIAQACKKQNITVTDADVAAEIERVARKNLPLLPNGQADVDRWLQLVSQQHRINPDTYRRNIVWPAVALRKLVGDNIQVSDDDLQKAFEANYGPRVRCRAIVMNNLRRAQQVWDKARTNPSEENFADLAEQFSADPATRALRGEIAPIQKHGGQPILEEEAFSLKPGEVSGIVQIAPETYVILFCLGQTKPVEVDLASVRDILLEDIKEKKTQLAMAEFYEKIRNEATIDNMIAGTTQSPKLSRAAAQPQQQPTVR